MTSTTEEINKIINAVIEDEKKLGQYASNSIPISDFIKEAIRQTKADCRDKFKEEITPIISSIEAELKEAKKHNTSISTTVQLLLGQILKRLKELLQKADEMFKEEAHPEK